jgi:hypothetical protein
MSVDMTTPNRWSRLCAEDGRGKQSSTASAATVAGVMGHCIHHYCYLWDHEARSAASMDPQPEIAAEPWTPEPRWPALIAVVAVGGLYWALPAGLTVGPRWLFPAVIGVLLVPTVISHRAGQHHLDRILGFTVTSLVTIEMMVSVILLVVALPSHRESPTALLLSAISIWVSNILVFALWYWRLDAGGPHGRDAEPGHTAGAFLFPQLTMPPEAKVAAGQEMWSPNFLDYLFLAFNTSTAFSPTDTPALARWGKVLMMLQSIISLTVLALLAARAVNIL